MKSPAERKIEAKEAFFLKKRGSTPTENGIYIPYKPSLVGEETVSQIAPLSNSKIGFIILAGGQSTRMNVPNHFPKGMLSVTPITRKSLLQIFFEKARSFEFLHKIEVHIALFVSESTRSLITTFLSQKSYFGLDKERVSLIEQHSLPFLDEGGTEVFDHDGIPMTGPDGNGSLLSVMKEYGLFKKWKDIGIEYTTVAQIDNPLLDPFYLPLLRLVQEHHVVYTAVKKKDLYEKAGTFVFNRKTEKVEVQEYSEKENFTSLIADPYTIADFQYANISQSAFQLEWAEKISDLPLPWHIAKKESNGIKYYKMEQFLFDILQYAASTKIIEIDRTLFFSPIKQQRGADSLSEAQNMYQFKDILILKKLLPEKKIETPLELHPFWEYYSAQEKEDRYQSILQNGPLSGYISPPEELNMR